MSTKEIITAKFGGSSLADSVHFEQVRRIAGSDLRRRYIVVSAPGKRYETEPKVTDLLYRLYDFSQSGSDIAGPLVEIREHFLAIIEGLHLNFDLESELNAIVQEIGQGASRDFVASRGEYLNAKLLSAYLSWDFVDAKGTILFTEEGAFLPEETNEALAQELSRHETAVIPGFYGSSASGKIFTFSRGGSDVSGALVARATGSILYENWTDVSGILTADPRIVLNPKPIAALSYRELRELSYMGATVIHENAVFPVRRSGIPIRIRNTNRPEDAGTLIVPDETALKRPGSLTGIAGRKGFAAITVEKTMMNNEVGFGARLLARIASHGLSFEHVPSGIDMMAVVIRADALAPCREELLKELQEELQPDRLVIEDDLSLIAVVGEGMIHAKGLAARIVKAVGDAGVSVRMIDASFGEMNVIIAVQDVNYETAIRGIYKEINEEL